MSRNSVQRAGDRAFFVSREIEGSSAPQCLSFWYYMYEPIVDNTGPNLGKLAVWVRTRDRDGGAPEMAPVWRLQNGQGPSWKYAQAKVDSKADFQVVVEGVWGNNRVSGYIAVDDVTVFEGDCDSEFLAFRSRIPSHLVCLAVSSRCCRLTLRKRRRRRRWGKFIGVGLGGCIFFTAILTYEIGVATKVVRDA